MQDSSQLTVDMLHMNGRTQRISSPSAVLSMTYDAAEQHTFSVVIDGQTIDWGYEDAQRALLDCGADPDRLSPEWTRHHYRQVVWKAACWYRSYPEEYGVWSHTWILTQLRYR